MAKAQDLLLDDDGDLFINTTNPAEGDLAVGESDKCHIEDIICADMGHWKQYPLLGVGVNRFLNAPRTQIVDLKSAIRSQLQADGFRVNDVKVGDLSSDINLEISAERIQS